MADLAMMDPWGETLPVVKGRARMDAVIPGALTLLAPYPGRFDEMAAALGGALPKPGTSCVIAGSRCLWFGRQAALLIGAPLAVEAERFGQVEDVSDGWAALRLSGADATQVLARLVPVDMRGMTKGAVVRTLLGHLPVAICGLEDGFEIYVMRSMAGTCAHEIADAMARVAGRGGLG